MIRGITFLILLVTFISCQPEQASQVDVPAFTLVIHGGAGAIQKANMTATLDSQYRVKLHEALDSGEFILKNGGTSLDAVTAAIRVMEDSPLFNAGKGAVFAHDGTNQMDASIMEGQTLRAGAVGGVTQARNPILAARAVMEQTDHVLLTGKGADQFIQEIGLDTAGTEYFFTQRRWDTLQKVLKKDKPESNPDHKFGTVGAVALDRNGNLAAGTSTGGMTNKKWNRIGDSPIIGAGTYADNRSCAVSCTGHGEYFIRYVIAHELSARMRYLKGDLDATAHSLLKDELFPAGGTGGLIALDKKGQLTMPFTTDGMYRGYTRPGERRVAIYEDEE